MAHHEVWDYETLATYLASSGITLPALELASRIVWDYFLHYQRPWMAYGFHLITQKYKHGVAV